MRIYFSVRGGHVHCRVFTTGSMCGTLVFTTKEWGQRSFWFGPQVEFIDEIPRPGEDV